MPILFLVRLVDPVLLVFAAGILVLWHGYNYPIEKKMLYDNMPRKLYYMGAACLAFSMSMLSVGLLYLFRRHSEPVVDLLRRRADLPDLRKQEIPVASLAPRGADNGAPVKFRAVAGTDLVVSEVGYAIGSRSDLDPLFTERLVRLAYEEGITLFCLPAGPLHDAAVSAAVRGEIRNKVFLSASFAWPSERDVTSIEAAVDARLSRLNTDRFDVLSRETCPTTRSPTAPSAT